MLDWAAAFKTRPRFYLVHGELASMQALKKKMRARLGISAVMPERGDSIGL